MTATIGTPLHEPGDEEVKARLIDDVKEMVEAFRQADKTMGVGNVVLYWLGQEGADPPDWWNKDGKRLWRALAALVCDAGLMGPGLHDACGSTGCLRRKARQLDQQARELEAGR